MIKMSTKQVSLRLREDTIQSLDHLCQISHQSRAALVADLVTVYDHAALCEAFGGGTLEDLAVEHVVPGCAIVTLRDKKA